MCINCIRSKVDITEGIPRQIVVFQCRGCGRWVVYVLCDVFRFLRPPWTEAPPESKELLAFCLKKIKGAFSIVGCNDRPKASEADRCRVRLDGAALEANQAEPDGAEGGVWCGPPTVLHCVFYRGGEDV